MKKPTSERCPVWGPKGLEPRPRSAEQTLAPTTLLFCSLLCMQMLVAGYVA